MNKGRRNEITKLKHQKRCKALGLIPQEHYEYKDHAKPCSCWSCRNEKYSRKQKHKI